MQQLRFAIIGTGFWARYQLAAWLELQGVRCVAVYNRTRAKAERLAQEFDIAAVDDDTAELLMAEKPDFILRRSRRGLQTVRNAPNNEPVPGGP